MRIPNITNYKPKEFAALLNVTVKTLQRWDRDKILVANRTPTNRRYYTYDQYLQFKGIKKDTDSRKVVLYARVSSRKQADDLENQVDFLQQYANAKGLIVDTIIRDYGSGLNYNRKKWNQLLDDVMENQVRMILVSHRDRFVRFGFDWFERFCKKFNVEIVVVKNEKLSPQEELVQDIVSISVYFMYFLVGFMGCVSTRSRLKEMRNLLKAFKTELRLTERQKDKVRRSLGICRFLANQYIARNIWLYRLYQRGVLDEKQRHFVTANDFDKYVNHVLKKKFPWIDQCGSKARKKVLVNAEQAFRRFFKGQAHFPRFKRKNQQNVKLYFPKNNKGDWTIWRHKIQFPTIGKVRLKELGYLPQGVTIKNGHVSYEAGRYYVSVTAEIEETSRYNNDLEASYHPQTDGIGVDLGVKSLAIVSDGRIFENINMSSRARRLEKRLRREQRRLSRKYEMRKKKGGSTATASANIEKKKLSVQRLHQRLANLRRNHENQVIHALVEQKPRFITVEDLNVTGMMKNRHLSKAVSEQRFYSFREKLRRKAEIIGIEFHLADRFYPSSKTCHACGHVHSGLKLKDRTYVCPACGYKEDRDLNAALNLRDTKDYRIA